MNVTYGRLMMCPEWMCTVEQSGQDYVGSTFGDAIDIAIGVLQASLVFWPIVVFLAVQR